MQLWATLVACALIGATTIGTTIRPADAEQRRKEGRRASSAERSDTADGRRSSTVDRRGLCVRDNGRPMDSLNLNGKCDREEFWARFNDLGGDLR